MVDTTDSKSVASNRVRVQVSSPVKIEYFVFVPKISFLRACQTVIRRFFKYAD